MKKRKVKHPVGTLVYYGPDTVKTKKIVAGVFRSKNSEPIIRRYVASDCLDNEKIQNQIAEFFADHGVRTVFNSGGNIGCPHEEGQDYPSGEDCPFCPYWKGRPRFVNSPRTMQIRPGRGFSRKEPNMGKNTGEVVVTLCLLGENDYQRLKDRGLRTDDYADYIEQFYSLQSQANTVGYKVVVLVFNEASFNEFLKEYEHQPVTEGDYAKARSAWAYWYVTSDPKRFGV